MKNTIVNINLTKEQKRVLRANSFTPLAAGGFAIHPYNEGNVYPLIVLFCNAYTGKSIADFQTFTNQNN